MDKKYRNWLGWSWLALVVVSLVLLFALMFILMFINVFFGFTVMWGIIGWALIFGPLTPIIMRKTWMRVLPEIKVFAKVIDKQSSNPNVRNNFTRNFLIFELSDRTRKVFDMTKNDVFYTILPNEEGILKFKEQGKHIYFISFERQ